MSTSTGQGFDTSGGISVPLSPGTSHAIRVAWGPESVTYRRDTATLPRPWSLGIVEATAQGSGITPPIVAPITINPFAGAEYSMTLCFGSIPVELQSFSIE